MAPALVALLCVAIGLAGCASQSTRGAGGPRQDILDRLLAGLGSGALVDNPTIQAPPPVAAGDPTPASTTDTWLELHSPATGHVDRVEAGWQAKIVISAYWRELRAVGDHTLKGGGLTFDTPSPDGGDTSNIWFPADAADYLFTDASGSPSKLVADTGQLEQHIRSEAATMGLVVKSLTFFSVLGTDVKLVAEAPDAVGFVQRYPDNSGNLFGDPGAIEGVFLAVYDPAGTLVKIASYSTGTQSGEGGLSTMYAKLVPGGVGGATTPPPGSATP